MEKLKDVVMKLFVKVDPEQKNSIQGHINNFISDFKPPDHPPYAAMIHRSIEELNKRRGSSEESISQYIRKQYTGLPLAHNSLLKHHLGELSSSGEILVTGKHLYLLPGTNVRAESCVTIEKDKPTREKRTRKGSGSTSRIGKKDEKSDEHGKNINGEINGETDRCNGKKDESVGKYNEMEVDHNADELEELIHVIEQTETQE